jgi:hypothetical protein
MFYAIDSVVLNACTKFSHVMQRMVGLTNYFIAKIGIAIASTDLAVQLLNYLHQFLRTKTSLTLVLLEIILAIDFYGRTHQLTKAEELLWSGSEVMPHWVTRFRVRPWRLLWLGIFTMDIVWVGSIWPLRGPYWVPELVSKIFFSFGLVIFYYFIAVDPLPPGKSKVRAWVDNLRQGRLTPVRAKT